MRLKYPDTKLFEYRKGADGAEVAPVERRRVGVAELEQFALRRGFACQPGGGHAASENDALRDIGVQRGKGLSGEGRACFAADTVPTTRRLIHEGPAKLLCAERAVRVMLRQDLFDLFLTTDVKHEFLREDTRERRYGLVIVGVEELPAEHLSMVVLQ